MSDTFEAKFKKVLKKYLVNTGLSSDDVYEVVSWDEDVEYGGYCSTCSYESTIVDIIYVDNKGKQSKYTYHGNFMEFVNDLLEYNVA